MGISWFFRFRLRKSSCLLWSTLHCMFVFYFVLPFLQMTCDCWMEWRLRWRRMGKWGAERLWVHHVMPFPQFIHASFVETSKRIKRLRGLTSVTRWTWNGWKSWHVSRRCRGRMVAGVHSTCWCTGLLFGEFIFRYYSFFTAHVGEPIF